LRTLKSFSLARNHEKAIKQWEGQGLLKKRPTSSGGEKIQNGDGKVPKEICLRKVRRRLQRAETKEKRSER